ncbi:MAG: 30S ribosomal protein S6 [Patescibacteria group bacterium]
MGLTEGRSIELNQYEIAVLYHPDLEVDLTKAEERVAKVVTDNGGKITATNNWGKRKLAYAIKGNEHAVYVFYTVELPGTSVAKVESTLNIVNEVIRFLITRPDLKAIAKAEVLKAEKAEQAAKRGERGGDSSDDEKDKESEE